MKKIKVLIVDDHAVLGYFQTTVAQIHHLLLHTLHFITKHNSQF